MAEKLWAGRFSKETDSSVNAFNSSIAFDARLAMHDIAGSRAHAAMLASCGIISQKDGLEIDRGLSQIASDLAADQLAFDPLAEDIHMFVEAELTRRIGDAGKRLHTGRSRNDQVALDLRLYLREQCDIISGEIKQFSAVLLDLAENHVETWMPGYTHLQRAQPITLAHHLMAYVEMMARDLQRISQTRERMNVLPLGSGALAATTYPLDREMVAKTLLFDTISMNSLDGVSDRDFAIELAADLSILMMHLSRLAEEIILWASQEVSFIELDDAYSTGSSIMPQKKNPDVAELCRGKTGRVYGDLQTLLTLMKGLPLAYNKDMQEDKEAIFDAVDTVLLCLPAMSGTIRTMTIHRENMAKAAAGGFTNATDLADYLVVKGMPFREAHEVSGKLVAICIRRGIALDKLSLKDFKEQSSLIEQDIYEAISLETCVRRRDLPGGPAPQQVQRSIEHARRRLASNP